MKKIIIKILPLLALSILLASCGASKNTGNKKPQIITTTSFVTETLEKVGGDRISATGLIGYGRDPHSYEPTPRQVALAEKADMIFVSGFDLEENLLDLLKNNSQAPMVELSAKVVPIVPEDGHDHGGKDPHTWMSPRNMMLWVDQAVESLSALSPADSAFFRSNGEKYKKELADLDKYLKEKFASLPPEKRLLITDHDSLSYFARDYGFTIEGTLIPGTTTNSDTSTAAMMNLISKLKETNIPVIFVGDTSGDAMAKLAETVSAEAGHPISIEILKTGSLDKKGSTADNYIGYMKYNADLIVKGLKGK